MHTYVSQETYLQLKLEKVLQIEQTYILLIVICNSNYCNSKLSLTFVHHRHERYTLLLIVESAVQTCFWRCYPFTIKARHLL